MSDFEEFEKENKELEIAPIYSRIIAFVIDVIIYWLLIIAFGVLFGQKIEGFHFVISGFPALVLLVLFLLLWPISEGVYGQTIGKRFMDIKVIGNKDKEMTIGRGCVRFLLGFIDVIFLRGIVIAIFDKNSNRLGDIIADTTVIKSKYNG